MNRILSTSVYLIAFAQVVFFQAQANNSCELLLNTKLPNQHTLSERIAEDSRKDHFAARPEIRPHEVLNSFQSEYPYFYHGITPNFSVFKMDHVIPAYKEFLDYKKSVIEAIVAQTTPATFENTILPLEELSVLEERVGGYFFSYDYLYAGDQSVKAVKKPFMALISVDSPNMVYFNEQLYHRLASVDKSHLQSDQAKALKDYLQRFEEGGVQLSSDHRKEFEALQTELSHATDSFSQNVIASNNARYILLKDDSLLAGLTDAEKEKLASYASEKNKKGYLIPQSKQVRYELLRTLESSSLRKKVWILNARTAAQKKFDNQTLAKKIVDLRQKIAKLLGRNSHLDLTLESRMVENRDRLSRFIQSLADYYQVGEQREMKELLEFAKAKYGVSVLEPWDIPFFSAKMKEAKYSLDPNDVKKYFEINSVWKGVFLTAEKLYGISIKESDAYTKPDPDVKVFELRDNDKILGVFYLDMYTRKNKKEGAWQAGLFTPHKLVGDRSPAYVWITTNVPKAVTGPTLLDMNEVTTAFHEFGHGLHTMLTQARYVSQAGTNVSWDMVELPSQVMENFAYEPEILKTFAFNVNEPHEVIPSHLIEALRQSQSFQSATAGMRQLMLASIDFNWYSGDHDTGHDVGRSIYLFEKNVKEQLGMFKDPNSTADRHRALQSTDFNHIFSGGYSAGYYSYKWAEMLDADAFDILKQAGLLESDAPAKFRQNILEVGGSVPALEAYLNFAGREATIEPMLRRDGLLTDDNKPTKTSADQ